MFSHKRIKRIKSIIILPWIIMLLACKNDLNQVNELGAQLSNLPEMSGEELEMIYSDSAMIKYRVLTPHYLKRTEKGTKYDEFPQGVHIISYDKNGAITGSIKANYAQRKENDNIWEARDQVVVTNNEGSKLETELLFWNMETKRIYTQRYSRLTLKNNIIEANNGFESDQSLKNPIFNNIKGEIEYEAPANTP